MKLEKNPVYSMNPGEYNKKLAQALKEIQEFKEPEWAMFVKSSVARARIPMESDFWHKRAASILRQIYINKIVGVNRLRTRYGGRQKRGRGFKPEHFKKGSGKIIRTILQQAEKAGLLEKAKEKRSGRRLTESGRQLLENISNSQSKSRESREAKATQGEEDNKINNIKIEEK